jgi:hypothetical protein
MSKDLGPGGNAVELMGTGDSTSMLKEVYAWYKNSQHRTDPGVLYRGVVVDNVDPDGYGRVKILVHSITASKGTKDEAMWAWTLSGFGPGQTNQNSWGTFMPYMIGSTVIVGFAQSDSNYAHPIVLGGWTHKNERPEECYDQKEKGKKIPRAWGWKSPKGHTMEYREEDDNEQIILKTFGGTTGARKLVLSDKKDNEFISIIGAKGGEILLKEGKDGTKITIMDPAGDYIQIDEKAQSILLSAKKNIFLLSDKITLAANSSIQLLSKEVTATGSTMASFMSTGGKTILGSVTAATNIDGLTLDIGSMSTTQITSITSTTITSPITTILSSTSLTMTTGASVFSMSTASSTLNSTAISIIGSGATVVRGATLALMGNPVTASNPL